MTNERYDHPSPIGRRQLAAPATSAWSKAPPARRLSVRRCSWPTAWGRSPGSSSRTSWAPTSPRRSGTCCSADDDVSLILQRFVWDVPLKFKRKFIRAIDEHLSGPLPDVQGAVAGLAGRRTAFRRTCARRTSARRTSRSSTRATSATWASATAPREVDLFVWLEVLRDKQCEDRPCEIGVPIAGKTGEQGRLSGQDPHPRDAATAGHRPLPRGAGADRELQSAAERHRPRLSAGTAMPGRVHHHRAAHRDRPARMVSCRSAKS